MIFKKKKKNTEKHQEAWWLQWIEHINIIHKVGV